MKYALAVVAGLSCLFVSAPAIAESTVELSNVHLCCGACSKAVEKAVKDIDGVKVSCVNKESLVKITGDSDAAVQEAVDAIVAAGFHGKSSDAKFKITEVAGVPEGNVERLEFTGTHNCCGSCNRSIKKAIASVDGVKADTAASKQSSFVVEGDFSAAAVVKALTDAGFHVQVKK